MARCVFHLCAGPVSGFLPGPTIQKNVLAPGCPGLSCLSRHSFGEDRVSVTPAYSTRRLRGMARFYPQRPGLSISNIPYYGLTPLLGQSPRGVPGAKGCGSVWRCGAIADAGTVPT
jgi:hypothetical protein